MTWEPQKLYLRRFEVQVHYHAAYLFWNLRGILPERWAHGPHFGAYNTSTDTVTLLPATDEANTKVGVYGLKVSAFNWERREEPEGRVLALEWLSDCLEVLQPRQFTRVQTKVFYCYPVKERELPKLTASMTSRYGELAKFLPERSGQVVNPGLSYNTRQSDADSETVQLAVYGVYHRDQRATLFASEIPDEAEWALGLQVERITTLHSDRLTKNLTIDDVERMIDQNFDEARSAVESTMIWDVGNAK